VLLIIGSFPELSISGEGNVLRITVQEREREVRLVLEGRLEQSLVPELERAFLEEQVAASERPIIVDLCGLTGMDEAGESTLQTLYARGAQLRCADVMNEYLVERMALGRVNGLQAPCRPCAATITSETHKEK